MPNLPVVLISSSLLINSGGGIKNKEGEKNKIKKEFGKGAFGGIMCQMGLGILGEYNSKLKLNNKTTLVFFLGSRFFPLHVYIWRGLMIGRS